MVSETRTETLPSTAPAIAPVEAPVPEPTGPGTAAAAQEQLRATEKPPSTILTEDKPAEAASGEAPAAFDAEKITVPEGMTLDKELFGKFGEIAKAHGLTQPAAQAMVDLYSTVAKQTADANRTAWNTTLTGWEAEVRADKDVIGKASLKGEDGTVLQGVDAVKATVAKVLDNPQLTDPKFREALELTGIGSHPAAIRTLYKWAQALTEGSGVRAGGPSPNVGQRDAAAPRSAARTIYPNLP